MSCGEFENTPTYWIAVDVSLFSARCGNMAAVNVDTVIRNTPHCLVVTVLLELTVILISNAGLIEPAGDFFQLVIASESQSLR